MLQTAPRRPGVTFHQSSQSVYSCCKLRHFRISFMLAAQGKITRLTCFGLLLPLCRVLAALWPEPNRRGVHETGLNSREETVLLGESICADFTWRPADLR